MTKTPVWMITGCSTGFGRELVQAVSAHGHRVVATARNVDTLAEFAGNPAVLLAPLDVTDRAQIAAAVEQAIAKFGQIDVLVNNAGYGYLAAVEEGEDAEVRAMFDANVFGLADVTKAVLPGMRGRRSGHIVNISSMAGIMGFPGIGYTTRASSRSRGCQKRSPRNAHRLAFASPSSSQDRSAPTGPADR